MRIIEQTKSLRKDFTATGYVVNSSRTKMLVIFHNKLQKWLPAGGHVEQGELPHETALREVHEETGITAKIVSDDPDLRLKNEIDCQIPRPYAMMYQIIPENNKDVEHIHIDFVYVMEAEEKDVEANLNEVANVSWLTRKEILKSDCFDSVKGFATQYLI